MKTKLLIVLSLTFVFIFNSNAQINIVNTTGNLAIGDITDPSVYKLYAKYGNVSLLGLGQYGYGSRILRLYSTSTFNSFSINSYELGSTPSHLKTRIGINYDISGGDGTAQMADVGSKNAPFFELNAEDGSISFFGENGAGGANFRNCQSTSHLGMYVKNNGYVGIGLSTPAFALDVNGSIAINGYVVISSDARLKTNIVSLTGALNSIKKLRGVSYRMKNPIVINSLSFDSLKNKNASPTIDTSYYNRNHIGFIAQELQTVFPQLVYTGSDSLLKVDYISIIPVLVEALKDQQAQIDSLKALNKKNSTLLKSGSITANGDSIITATAMNMTTNTMNISAIGTPSLDQNAPNPFSQNTNIGYYLPENIHNAVLNIYDMNGVQIKTIPIATNGRGSILIHGYELRPGMFFYSLIADGQEISTKRMILTD